MHRLALRDTSHEVGEAEQRLHGRCTALSDVLKDFSGDRLGVGRPFSLTPLGFKLDLETGEKPVELSGRFVDLRLRKTPIPLAKRIAVENTSDG